MLLALLIILVVLALVGLPDLGWRHRYGYYPSGIIVVLLIVILILVMTGNLSLRYR